MSNLIELVKAEAAKLRELFTPEEKKKLQFSKLKPESKARCIYGLATGYCDSDRAVELIRACCTKIYRGIHYTESPKKLYPGTHRYNFYSPIERYIVTNRTEERQIYNKRLLRYLKGKTDILDIE